MPTRRKKRTRSSFRLSKTSEAKIPDATPSTSELKQTAADEGSNDTSQRIPDACDKTQLNADLAENGASKDVVMRSGFSASGSAVVMQCAACRTILADTTSGLLEVNKRAGTISCTSVHNISISSDIETKTTGIHSNCTYRGMHCKHCGQNVGRKFVSTTTEFDSIRGAFTFDKASLLTHELGAGAGPKASGNETNGDVGSSELNSSASRSLEELLSCVTESMNGLWTKMAALEKENLELRRNFLALERKLQVHDEFRLT